MGMLFIISIQIFSGEGSCLTEHNIIKIFIVKYTCCFLKNMHYCVIVSVETLSIPLKSIFKNSVLFLCIISRDKNIQFTEIC